VALRYNATKATQLFRLLSKALCDMTKNKKSILSRTNQAWKYYASLIIDFIGFIIFSLPFIFQTNPQQKIPYFTVALICFVIGFYIQYNMKCPKCKVSWYLLALKKPLELNSIVKIRLMNSCPKCGFKNEKIT